MSETQQAWANPLRFPGQYYDQETGTYYNYFRDYDPAIGRYMQADPIGLRGGFNTYLYANANSTRFFDPYGLEKIERLIYVLSVVEYSGEFRNYSAGGGVEPVYDYKIYVMVEETCKRRVAGDLSGPMGGFEPSVGLHFDKDGIAGSTGVSHLWYYATRFEFYSEDGCNEECKPEFSRDEYKEYDLFKYIRDISSGIGTK
ncbi:RHS repeat-associated core domain-containing protein [Sedimenticola thiotaurini]|uniref:RHS repeat-associated core domain-containing protein n=1 Tax=Sedimenticola thiotaurini TaxID=1543721 RepID=UPI002FF887CA